MTDSPSSHPASLADRPPSVGADSDAPSPEEIASEIASLALRTPATIDSLISRSPAVAREAIQARIDALREVRLAALAATSPNDWTLNRDKGGHVTATLRRSGAEKVRKYYAITVRPRGEVRVYEEQVDRAKRTVAEVTGDGYCGFTGEAVFGIVGRRLLGEEFTGRPATEVGTGDLRHAARTSLDTKLTRILAGMSSVSTSDLATAWKCEVAEVEQACYRGHGFGKSADRQAADTPLDGPLTWDREGKRLWAVACQRGETIGLKGEAIVKSVLEAAGVAVGRCSLKDTIGSVPRAKFADILKAAETYEPAPAEPGSNG